MENTGNKLFIEITLKSSGTAQKVPVIQIEEHEECENITVRSFAPKEVTESLFRMLLLTISKTDELWQHGEQLPAAQ